MAEMADPGQGVFPVDSGSINFKFHSTVRNPEFIRVRPKVVKTKLVNHAIEQWGLDPHPGCLLRVTGSVDAQAQALPEVLEGLVRASHKASAWILSTGLDFGVAAMVGRILGLNRHICESPLIGVASWATVQGADQLLKTGKGKVATHGTKRNYNDCKPDKDMSTVSLQPNHTHFILVGDPGDAKYDESMASMTPEAKLLAARKQSFVFAHDFEHEVRQVQLDLQPDADEDQIRLSPRVLFVVNGDKTTLEEILTYIRVGEGKVLVAAGTGGLADALSSFVDLGTVPPGWGSSEALFDELRELNTKRYDVIRKDEEAAAMREPSRRMSVGSFKAKSEAGKASAAELHFPFIEVIKSVRTLEVEEAILDCVISQGASISARVMYAVRWNDGERLQKELTMIPTWSDRRMDILCESLQLSLELEAEEAVRVCVDNAAPVKDIDLLALYDKLYDKASPPRFQIFSGQLPTLQREKKLAQASLGASFKSARKSMSPTRRGLSSRRLSASGAGSFGISSKRVSPGGLGVSADLPPPGADAPAPEAAGFVPLPEEDPEDAVMDYYPEDVWNLLKNIVPGLTLYWIAKIKAFKEAAEEAEATGDGKPVQSKLGARWIDIYVWAVLLGNTELSLLLLPSCREPMRAAIIGARLCNNMAGQLPLHKIALEQAALKHEAFTVMLLDLCENFDDARRMLITKSRHWNRTVLQLGLQSGLRNFCAHGHCQSLCDEFFRGNLDAEKYQTILNIHGSPGFFDAARLIFRAFVPIRMPCFGPATRWSTPVGTDEEEAIARGMTPRIDYYRIPAVKQLLRFFFHTLYVMLISYACMETSLGSIPDDWEHMEFHEGGGLESGYTDLMVWIWTIGLAFDEWFKVAQDPDTFSLDFWNKYDYSVLTFTCLALVMRFFSITFAVEILSFAVLLVWCRLFKYLTLSQEIGLLVIMIMEMFKDIALWTLVSLVFLGAFTVAFVSISDPYVLHGSPDHPLTVPLWAMLGTFDVHEVTRWNGSVGPVMLWTYVVVSQIILVNLLIAMMGHTFGVIKERADEEWKFGRLRSVLEATERMHPIPPPLNLPITVGAFVHQKFGKYLVQWLGETPSLAELTAHKDKGDLSAGKKAKEKVAKKLLLAFKRREEADNEAKIDAKVESLYEGQKVIAQSVQDVNEKLRRLELLLTSKSSASSLASKLGMGTGRAAA